MPSAYIMPSVSIPSASECLSALSFLRPVVPLLNILSYRQSFEQWLTAHYIPSLIFYDPFLLSLSVAPYSIFPSFSILTDYGVYFRWWSCVFFLSRRENYLCGTPRATAHLMLWTRGEFLLAVLLTMASLRLPCPFILYIMGALLLISPISFLLIFEKETVTLNFVSLFFNSVT